MKKTLWLTLLVIFSFALTLHSQEPARLLRFPAIFQDQIVFSYAGDLYGVAATGGTARKLTSHEGYEMFPRFSPDGKLIAFTGQYDGNTEVFLIPAQGGVPKRLTFTATLGRDDVSDRMGPNNLVMGWTNDGKQVVYRSRQREWNDFIGQLFLVGKEGGLSEQLPLPRGGFCSFAPDGKKLAYNRVFREFRTWKRYRGGMADDIWIYDFDSKKTENITDNPAQDIIPMWSGDKIYFLSDRDANQRMNLYLYDLKTRATRALTQFTEFDIKFPSLGPNAIVFECGGYIHRLDLATEQTRQVPIVIAEDLALGRDGLIEVSRNVSNYEIAPDGKRALFGARGDVFTVPAENGATRNLTRTPGAHERNSKWSPDGKWIAYVSDRTGEDEIFIIAQDGSQAEQQITRGSDTYMYGLLWSPDSKKLLWSDRKQRLRYVDIQVKQIVEVNQASAWEINDFSWSPDSKWIVFVRPEEETMSKIYLYSLDDKKILAVTDGWYDVSQPVFGSDGKFLFFVSDRNFNPTYSQVEWNYAYQDLARIYLVTLTREAKSPFEPQSDEVTIKKEEEKSADKKASKEPAKDEKKEAPSPAVVVKVDAEGLADRVLALPIKTANYWNLSSVGDKLYYMKRASEDTLTALKVYDFKDKKETDLGAVNGFEISADQKKMLVSQQGSYAIIDLPSAKIEIKKRLDLSGMEMQLDRRAEWTQIFNECWRQMREFFYVPNMHGVDWPAMRQKYLPLVAGVSHRADLTYIIGEMIGELNVGHAYVGGGEYPKPKRIQTGLLGAQLGRGENGFVRIQKILKGQNWNSKSLRSPLTEIGVNAKEGEYIISIDGRRTDALKDPYEALVNSVGKQVVLELNASPQIAGSRKVTVIPIADETELYYFNWVQNNIQKVSQASNGKVGYIHIPDMGVPGLNEFVEYFYPQLRKKALIVDVRGNGGGNVSSMILERLKREVTKITKARNAAPGLDPGALVYGPKVCLLNEFSASDGDIFPYRFKKHNLGKLIGKRSWGGVVGIRGSLPLLDGGYLNKPEFARYDVEGKDWLIEGRGVDPDIVIDNDPAREYAGIDEQLNKAIEVILDELKTQEKQIPPPPPDPIKR